MLAGRGVAGSVLSFVLELPGVRQHLLELDFRVVQGKGPLGKEGRRTWHVMNALTFSLRRPVCAPAPFLVNVNGGLQNLETN
jgi:hypothetical protein